MPNKIRDWEDALPQALTWCQHREVAVDCGANIGNWSLELVKHFRRVVAFEPAIDVSTIGSERTRQYDVTWVHAGVCALENHDKRGVLFEDPKRRGRTRARFVTSRQEDIDRWRERGGIERDTQVRLVALDSWFSEQRQNLNSLLPISLIKIDIEGGEIYALQGARLLISVYRPVLILEIDRRIMLKRFTLKIREFERYLATLEPKESMDFGVNRVIRL